MFSRTGKDWTAAFPEVAAAVLAMGVDDAVLDGEVTSVLPDGRTSFQALQHATVARGTIVYFVFDLLRLNGAPLDALPLKERKSRLHRLFGRRTAGHVRYASHVEGSGEAFLAQACRLGLEGIISKRRDLPYRAGRHGGWLKTKCLRRQEFVIGGFTEPEGTRSGLGALVIGCYDDGRLVCAGKVGTGFTHQVALDLRQRLGRIEQSRCPFDPVPARPLARRAHWVAPSLVCEVAFLEWTADGGIRHPSFQGLRLDKAPRDVVREDHR